MTTIAKVHAREILDSRGNPTLEAEVTLSDGPNAWPLPKMRALLETLLELDRITKRNGFLETGA